MAHWKKSFNPDYLGAYSIEDGQDIVATIKSVGVETVTGDGGKKEDCLVARFVENYKPMILNKTNCKSISKIHKSPDTDTWVGKKIQIYATTTKFGRDIVDCLRIRETVPHETNHTGATCEMCGNPIPPAKNMSVEQVVAYSKKNFNKSLCGCCMRKIIEEKEHTANEGYES